MSGRRRRPRHQRDAVQSQEDGEASQKLETLRLQAKDLESRHDAVLKRLQELDWLHARMHALWGRLKEDAERQARAVESAAVRQVTGESAAVIRERVTLMRELQERALLERVQDISQRSDYITRMQRYAWCRQFSFEVYRVWGSFCLWLVRFLPWLDPRTNLEDARRSGQG